MFIRGRFTWLAYLFLAYYAYLQASPSPIMPFLREELGLNYFLTGVHFSAFALGQVLAGVAASRLARHWGRRFLLWGGAGGMALGVLFLTSSHQPILTLGSILFMGFSGSSALIVIQAGLSDEHGEQRATALTESNLLAIIAASLVPVAVGAAYAAGFGWRAALFIPVIFLLFLALRYHDVLIPAAQESLSTAKNRAGRLPALFWVYWIVILLGVSAEWSLIFWGPDYLQKVTGLSTVAAATAMSILLGAMVLGRFTGSLATRWIPANRLLLLSACVALAGFLTLWFASTVLLTLSGMFVAGLGMANIFPLTLSGGLGSAPDQTNLASARMVLGGGLAILLAPLVLGWLAGQMGIEQAFALVALFIGLALIMILVANRAAKIRTSHSVV